MRAQRAVNATAQGLMHATPLQQFRFGAGFLALAIAAPLAIITLVTGRLLGSGAEWATLTAASVWWGGLVLLTFRRFAVGPSDAKYAASAPPWVVAVTLLTQAGWTVGLLLPPPAVPWVIGSAALGLFTTFYVIGDLIEWAGDHDTGDNLKWTLLSPILLALMIGFALLVLTWVIPHPRGLVTGAMAMAALIGLLWAAFRVQRTLIEGIQLALWARRAQIDRAGKIARLDAKRQAIDEERAARVRTIEAQHIAGRAGADRPVGPDDFQTP